MKNSYSLPPEHVSFECETTFLMALEIEQIIVQPSTNPFIYLFLIPKHLSKLLIL